MSSSSTGGPYEFIYTNNNTNVAGPVTVTLTPAPDLTPTQIVAPTTAAAGDQVDVSWTVQNLGPGDANTPWTDSLQLSQVGGGARSTTWASSPIPSRSRRASPTPATSWCSSPPTCKGVFQFSVTTAAGLFENGATGNDTYADPDLLTLTLPPNPDLQVSSVTAPSKANAGGTVSRRFHGHQPGDRPHHHAALDRQRLPLAQEHARRHRHPAGGLPQPVGADAGRQLPDR